MGKLSSYLKGEFCKAFHVLNSASYLAGGLENSEGYVLFKESQASFEASGASADNENVFLVLHEMDVCD